MTITTLTSRDFDRRTGHAKKAAAKGPVFITNRGRATHVLMTVEAYQALARRGPNIIDMLAMPATAHIEFEPPRVTGPFARPADLA